MRFEWPEFGRCCCCIPLRNGILSFAYIRLVLDLLWATAFSMSNDRPYGPKINGMVIYNGVVALRMGVELCIALILLDIIFVTLLLYGSHMKVAPYIKAFYYYGIIGTAAAVLLKLIQVSLSPYRYDDTNLLLQSFVGVVIHVYLLTITRSLQTKMERPEPHQFENKLQEVIFNNNLSPAMKSKAVVM